MTTSDDDGVIRVYKREYGLSTVSALDYGQKLIIATYAKTWKLLGKMTAEEPPAEGQ